MDGFKLF
jgi:hypothetical protein